jgi:hypothetical protein
MYLITETGDAGGSPERSRRVHGLLPHLRLHDGARLHLLPRTQVCTETVSDLIVEPVDNDHFTTALIIPYI